MKPLRKLNGTQSQKKSSAKDTASTADHPAPQKNKLGMCRYCGGNVAPDATSCVHCGTHSPLEKEKTAKTNSEQMQIARFLWKVLGILFCIALLSILLIPECRL